MDPSDQPGIVEVVRSVYADYGFTWDIDGYCHDLTDPLAHHADFWVVRNMGQVVGCIGLSIHDRVTGEPGGTVLLRNEVRATGSDCELVRLYLLAQYRGQGLGRALAQQVVDAAHAHGRTCLEIWSDKKLVEAHSLYERMGAMKVGERICPGDPDESPEWGFALVLGGVQG